MDILMGHISFPILEFVGVFFGLIATWQFQKVKKIFGGLIGVSLGLIQTGVIFIVLSFFVNFLFHLAGWDDFIYDLIHEIFMYIGIMLITVAAYRMTLISKKN